MSRQVRFLFNNDGCVPNIWPPHNLEREESLQWMETYLGLGPHDMKAKHTPLDWVKIQEGRIKCHTKNIFNFKRVRV